MAVKSRHIFVEFHEIVDCLLSRIFDDFDDSKRSEGCMCSRSGAQVRTRSAFMTEMVPDFS